MLSINRPKNHLFDSNQFHTHYHVCTYNNCGYEFEEADWTYFGVDTEGNWQHVCEKHRDHITWKTMQVYGHLSKELYRVEPYLIPSYTDPPQPNTDLWLWRYMNLWKFESFIKTKSIFMTKASVFDDPLECAVGVEDRKSWLNSIRSTVYQESLKEELQDKTEEYKKSIIDAKIQEEAQRNNESRKDTYISCWHISDHESQAMWQLYKGRYHQTVAITVNMCNLRNSLPKPIHMGQVFYENYERVYPTKIRAFKKHISYKHENEFRIVIFPENVDNPKIKTITVEKNEKGMFIKPAEEFLQIYVYISPWSSNNFRKRVKRLISQAEWSIENGPTPAILAVIEPRYDPIY